MSDYIVVNKINSLKGEITIPADKSISHRSVIIGSLTKGKINIKNFSLGGDCLNSLEIIKQLGGEVEFISKNEFNLDCRNCYKSPKTNLNCGNSGTSMRLFSGLLAGQNFKSVLYGDESLSKRPMKRVIEPLELMGAKIKSNDNKAPLEFLPSVLHPIKYKSKIASAQVKSCILIGGFSAEGGETSVIEPYLSRNHSELMLKYFDSNIKTEKISEGYKTSITKSELTPKDIVIPGDISSAAFFLVAGAITKNSSILIKNVGLNPTRTGIIDVMLKMGADIKIADKRYNSGEDTGDILVKYSPDLKGIKISGRIIPRLIDELPIIAVLATQAEGETRICDAADLRNKESDRIKEIVYGLRKLGANIEETNDGFIINGKTELTGDCELNTSHDHRLVMSYFVASLISKKPVKINGISWINTSFPEFLPIMSSLGYN